MITKNIHRFTIPTLATAGVVLAGSLAWSQPVVVVAPTSPPPAPLIETIPPPPGSATETFVWRPGHWSWVDGRWSWNRGSYIIAMRPDAAWMPGSWRHDPDGAYVWVEGHWR